VARGVAVFGSPGLEPDAATMRSLFGHHERLAEWLSKAGHDLTYDADCLAVVESSIDSWRDNTQISPMLANEVGTFLGTVRVAEGASWHVWPNGHPVVRVAARRDIDVFDLAAQRVSSGRPNLSEVLTNAVGR